MNIEKLADQFQERVSGGDVFGRVSYIEEAERLKMLAGKLNYKSEKEADRGRANKLKEAARLALLASDMLRSA